MRLLRLSEAAERLAVGRTVLRVLIAGGYLPAVRLPAGGWRVREIDLDNYIRTLGRTEAVHTAAPADFLAALDRLTPKQKARAGR